VLARFIRIVKPLGRVILSLGFILISSLYVVWQHVGQTPAGRRPAIKMRARSFSITPSMINQRLSGPKSSVGSAAAPKGHSSEHIRANSKEGSSRGTSSVAKDPIGSPIPVPPSPSPSTEVAVAAAGDATTPPVSTSPEAQYRDGQYIGDSADIDWGNLQVVAIIKNGQLTDVQFEVYPFERHASLEINGWALPILVEEAIRAQSANVDVVSQASFTSYGFHDSLESALKKAKR